MVLLKIAIFVTVFSVVYSEPDTCIAANGSKGQCVSVFKCQPILTIISKPNISSEEANLLENSGYCSEEHVCCPTQVNATPATPATSQCFTPEGKPGQCISLYSCPDLVDLLHPPATHDKIHYVQKSKCDGLDHNSVCCGPVPDFTSVQKGSCAAEVSALPPDPSTGCCGIDSSVGTNIRGDLPLTVDQYPWLVVVEYINDEVVKALCGGALISGNYVLTAAHCLTGAALTMGTPISVRLAEYDMSHEGPDCNSVEAGGEECTEDVTRIPIEKMIPHPQYNTSSPQRWHDIALIKLAEMAPYSKFIRPICLPKQDVSLKTGAFNLTAAGWGTVSQTNSSVKSHVHLPFINQTKCQAAYRAPGRNVTLWQGQLCAGGDQNVDPCKGDSGGPLMYKNGNYYEVAGIVSFGPIPCGSSNIPSVFTNVYEYDDWIRNNIVP